MVGTETDQSRDGDAEGKQEIVSPTEQNCLAGETVNLPPHSEVVKLECTPNANILRLVAKRQVAVKEVLAQINISLSDNDWAAVAYNTSERLLTTWDSLMAAGSPLNLNDSGTDLLTDRVLIKCASERLNAEMLRIFRGQKGGFLLNLAGLHVQGKMIASNEPITGGYDPLKWQFDSPVTILNANLQAADTDNARNFGILMLMAISIIMIQQDQVFNEEMPDPGRLAKLRTMLRSS